MHELSVCIALLEQVERIAREHDARSVSTIVLKLGPLSGVEPELLRHAYPLAAAGTLAESAELRIEDDELVVVCNDCGERSSVPPNRLLCSGCGGFRTRVVSGEDMLLQRVELSPTP